MSNKSKKYDRYLVLKLSIVVFDSKFTMVDEVPALERNQTSDSSFFTNDLFWCSFMLSK